MTYKPYKYPASPEGLAKLSPAQPAPVTPPPEPWMEKARKEVNAVLFRKDMDPRFVSVSDLTDAILVALTPYLTPPAPPAPPAPSSEAECEFPCDYCGSKKHASPNCEKAPVMQSPPAPSCTTEQGETPTPRTDHFRSSGGSEGQVIRDLLDFARTLERELPPALSRQPAPSADAARHKWSDEYIADLRARIASLEAELAEEQKEHRELYEQQLKMREALHNRDTHIAFLEAQLRAAPSAVAKDRADALAEITRWLATYKTGEVSLAHAADMIANLLSQPAVAQTEAGNKDSARLDWLAQGWNSQWHGRQRVAGKWLPNPTGSLRDAIDAEMDPAVVMSSPKSVSVSVPAVAGGGEDGARLDWLEKHANFIEVGHTDIGPTRIEIDAAIAATKAKEGKL